MSVVEKAFLNRLGKRSHGCVFRGHADSRWKLLSAATRRLIKYFNQDESVLEEFFFAQMHLVYLRTVLLDPARELGFGVVDGRRMSDLQLLARLQGYGAATNLLHFSRNPLAALWNACEESELDGKVIALDLEDGHHFSPVSRQEAELTSEELLLQLTEQGIHVYIGATDVERGIEGNPCQDDFWVTGWPLIPAAAQRSIEIRSEDKQRIRRELIELYGFLDVAPSVDVQRFSVTNGAQFPLPLIDDPEFSQLQGNQCYVKGDYLGAISYYDKGIACAPDVSGLYFSRGNAKAEAGNYDEACADYDAAIRCEEKERGVGEGKNATADRQLWRVFFNRGNAKTVLGQLDGAVADYDEAIRLGQRFGVRYSWFFLNRANAKQLTQDFQGALQDYDEAIRIGNIDARFNKGNALVMMGRFDEALQCYEASVSDGDNRAGVLCNRKGVEGILSKLGSSGYKVRPPRFKEQAERLMVEVSVKTSPSNVFTEFYYFLGMIGNTGNAGAAVTVRAGEMPIGKGIPGGAGYQSWPGFIVLVKGEEW